MAISPLDFQPLLACASCLEGKMTKRPFSTMGNKGVLELVHKQECDPQNVKDKWALSISLLLLMITQGIVMFICYTKSPRHLKS